MHACRHVPGSAEVWCHGCGCLAGVLTASVCLPRSLLMGADRGAWVVVDPTINHDHMETYAGEEKDVEGEKV